LPETELNKLRH